jgi:methionyl-tRNA formyltransferase
VIPNPTAAKSPSSVIVFGYGELGIAAVQTIAEAGARIVAMVLPSNRSGDDVDRMVAFASHQRLPVWVQPPRRAVDPFVLQLREAAPDVIVVWSYSMILPQAVLDVPRLGVVNVHGGLLPEYRGGHVMQWAIINGETETGVTLHYVDRGIDTGPVIADARFPIDAGDDAVRVRSRLKASGAELLRRWWPQIAAGTAPRAPQDETRARHWPLRTSEDGRIDWTMTNGQICRVVRALACNEPGAFVEVDHSIVTIRAAHPVPSTQPSAAPGRIGAVDSNGVRVSAGAGDVLVTKLMVGGVIKQNAAVADVLRPGASLLASISSE